MANINQDIVNKTKQIFADKKPVWEKVYKRYADGIKTNIEKYELNAKKFQVNAPLTVYSSIGKVIDDASTTIYDLRYAGQSVGEIHVNIKGKVLLYVTDKQASYAKDNFGFTNSRPLNGVDWHKSKAAVEFRKAYKADSTDKVSIKSEEHRIENFLLKEFAKKTRAENKKLCNIQPVRLGGKFFQLTTPINASKHVPKPAFISEESEKPGANGGGIDILARVKHSQNESRIAIIELKDENKPSEPQKDVMTQALAYATFVAFLLRSECGKDWYNIFRENFEIEKDVPEKLDLYVATLMPEGTSEEGDLADIEIEELNVTLHLYTLYYKRDKDGNPDLFSGTLTEAIMK